MLQSWRSETLQRLNGDCDELLRQFRRLEQAKRRERGAYVKPGLAGSVSDLENVLLRSYARLEEDVLASLTGPSDDVHSGRVLQEEEDQSVDAARLGAVLALLALWRRRHIEIAGEFAAKLFDQGRAAALAEIRRPQAQVSAGTAALKTAVLDRYATDIDRLQDGLENGTPRSQGLRALVTGGLLLGSVLALVRQLFDAERYRVEMFSESLPWTAFSEGYRAGAVDGTRDILHASEYGDTALEMMHDGRLPLAFLDQLPEYRWTGPDDEKTCGPCRAEFHRGVRAVSLQDLPAPQDICAFGRACRHFWVLATSE